ncbi:MAG: DNA methyltransferase, partial [Microcystis panniformis]
MAKGKGNSGQSKEPKSYNHVQTHPQRPDIGTEPHFKKKKLPATYRYDSSLAPELSWDENSAREKAEALIAKILEAESLEEAKVAASQLKAMSQPFLNWAGKSERESFEVPTLPLFVHERLSTRAIIETLKSHKIGSDQLKLDLFNDPQWSISDQILRAYEYHDKWVNRMILGDSLVTMNSLLQYEGMGGKVQMIYIDPPYGVKFGSNFQPFVRKRDVKHNDDADFTREPEMVQAYRDTWELGLHSYLSYLRDRLLLARELLTESGSVFVQISDENVHHVRELMDEVFGEENFIANITYKTKKMTMGNTSTIETIGDHIIFYAKDTEKLKCHSLFTFKDWREDTHWRYIELPNGERRTMTTEERNNPDIISEGSKVFIPLDLRPSGYFSTGDFIFEFNGTKYSPGAGKSWRTNKEGMDNLAKYNRLYETSKALTYVLYHDDYP